MTNFEELLNIKLNEDKYTLAEITIEYCKRGHHPVPEWAINTRQEGRCRSADSGRATAGRRKEAALPAAESVVTDRGAGVRKTRKRRG